MASSATAPARLAFVAKSAWCMPSGWLLAEEDDEDDDEKE